MNTTPLQQESELIDFWNRILAPKFIRFRHILVEGTSKHSDQVLPTLDVKQDASVVDIGCGFGDTAIKLARMVGPTGRVLGIDCCEAFLEHGRQDAALAGITNLAFLEADAQTHPFEPIHDAVFSRFGTQFFENPVAGLSNMRAALRPGGTMTMIVWRALEESPCMNLPKQVVAAYLPALEHSAETCGPGPFSMADESAVRQQLHHAGYEAITFEGIDALVNLGPTMDEAIAFHLAIGPAGELFREAGETAEERRDDILSALRRELAPFQTDEGVLMPSASWKITATNP